MTYRLGNIEVDPGNFLLLKDGETVSIEPLVFDLIVYLIEHRDRMLTRQELFDEIWAGKIVSDTSLSNHIKSARKALGDDGQRQAIIKTVHGRGYRFVAEVQEVASQDAADKVVAMDDRQTDRQPQASARKRWFVLATFVLLIVAVSGPNWFADTDEAIRSVAVLPLKNLSNDPAQKYFVEGMQDALITRLSRMTELRVISKTSTLRYETSTLSIPEIARELNVDALIEGSVLRDGNQVRITAQLIRGAEDDHLWARSYDRELEDVLPLINDISLAIANEIEVAVTQEQPDEWARKEPANLEVHELVLKGRHYFDRFMFDESLRHYQRAAELDAGFAPAHAGVAGSYLLKEFFGWAPDSDFIPRAREAALKAIALDSDSPGGHGSLGFIQLYFDWDWESARTNLLRALELRPNDALTRHAYADYLMVMGDLQGSLDQVEIGALYDPHSPMARNVVDFHRILARQYDDVIVKAREGAAENPALMAGNHHYHEALWLTRRHEEAFAGYKTTWGRDNDLLQAMEKGYAESGYTGAIHQLADTLAGRDTEFFDYVALARLYVQAGYPDEALSYLEKAYEYRQPQILHINAMPVFDALQSHPGFRDLLRRIGFPEAANS